MLRSTYYITLRVMSSMPQHSSPTKDTAMLTMRIDRELLAAFDAVAEGRGGRSALLRNLMQQAMKQLADAPQISPRAQSAGNRVSITLTDAEAAVVDQRAAERGVDRAGWIKALVRRHVGLKGAVDDGLRDAVAPVRMQLQRIGRNLNQAMKAGNAAMMADSGLQIDRELRRISDMREDINDQVALLGDALRGDLSFWKVAD
ncbi:hypothetical protein U5A82_21555 [Sphingobium sp. CR2-8]|uniref:hypothetical protein n=1 Tax=Sphingobium sp. CR2-8 TaxID=1306534 RepID=UPI002DBD5055|nr:hypothetical protein [Sphingobium sp. CR2-8]MEC3912962.1 hypothetical protein [Sphingobium sp. CR2-8]